MQCALVFLETTENKVSLESSNNLTNATKDFITRNIEVSVAIDFPHGRSFVLIKHYAFHQLAKNGAMATFSLTDEEKSKLETLLSDIGRTIVSVERRFWNLLLFSR